MSSIEPLPHLDLTEADIQALFDSDPVLREYYLRIAEQTAKIGDYENRRAGFKLEIDQIDERAAALQAELRSLDTQRREIKGADAGIQYHIRLSRNRISQREASIRKRQRFLYKNAVSKKLKSLAKEIQLDPARLVRPAA